jgi:hypothetical protein
MKNRKEGRRNVEHRAVPGKRRSKVHNRALKLLRDRNFLYHVGRKLGELGVVNEFENRLILVLAFLARVSVIIKGPSAAGKSSLLSKSTLILPPELVVKRATLSRKAPVHGDDSWAGKVLCLTEHVGGKEAQFLLRLMQSEDAIQDERTVIAGKKTGTVVTQVSGGLIIFTTTTQEKLYADDETRALSITIDVSPGQTLAILQARLGA